MTNVIFSHSDDMTLMAVLAALIIASVFYLATKKSIMSGPVEFHDKELHQIFHILSVSEDGDRARMIYDSEFPTTGNGREYLLPEGTPKPEVGKTYELCKDAGAYYLKQVRYLPLSPN